MNNDDNQFKSDLTSLLIKKLLVYAPAALTYQDKTKDIANNLADEIITLFKNKGKMGKSPFCQCETSDSQDSYAEMKKGVRTGRIICFDCNKPYGNSAGLGTDGKIHVQLFWDSKNLDNNTGLYPAVSNFWYWNKLGKSYQVRNCTCKGDLNDVEGTGTYEPTDFYMIAEGEYKGNVILKKHCKIQ